MRNGRFSQAPPPLGTLASREAVPPICRYGVCRELGDLDPRSRSSRSGSRWGYGRRDRDGRAGDRGGHRSQTRHADHNVGVCEPMPASADQPTLVACCARRSDGDDSRRREARRSRNRPCATRRSWDYPGTHRQHSSSRADRDSFRTGRSARSLAGEATPFPCSSAVIHH